MPLFVVVISAAVAGTRRPRARAVSPSRRRRPISHPRSHRPHQAGSHLRAAAAHQAEPGGRQGGLQQVSTSRCHFDTYMLLDADSLLKQ